MKNLRELFDAIHGIVENPPSEPIEPDVSWFDDLKNRQDMYQKNPNAFAHYNSKTNIPQFPIVNKQGVEDVKMMLHSLATAIYIQSKNPSLKGIEDVIKKLELVITKHRQDLADIPEYRVNIVRTKNVDQMQNNLIYGPHDANVRLANMISDLSSNNNMNLQTPQPQIEYPPTSQNVPDININTGSLGPNHLDTPSQYPQPASVKPLSDIEELIRDAALKTAELASMQRQNQPG